MTQKYTKREYEKFELLITALKAYKKGENKALREAHKYRFADYRKDIPKESEKTRRARKM